MTMAKKKAKTIAQLVDKAARLLQKLRRMESAGNDGYCWCVSCGACKHWKDGDGGHWLSRIKTATKLADWNINFQCKKCNGFPTRETYLAYEAFMVQTYGQEFVDYQSTRKNRTVNFARWEIEEAIDFYKTEIKRLEKEKML